MSGLMILEHIIMILAAGGAAMLNFLMFWLVIDKVMFRGINVTRAISGKDGKDGYPNIGVAIVFGLAIAATIYGSFMASSHLIGWVAN